MKCIVGLGNPGKKYDKTRHNIGFAVIDKLAHRHHTTLDEIKFKSTYSIITVAGEKVMFIKPQTFMNLSGEAVRPLIEYYKINIEDIVVIYDDLDLPVGKIRLREKGGHGGHNGIRSMIQHLGAKDFKRIRIGVGRPTTAQPIVDYVLKPFAKNELEDVKITILESADACDMWLNKSYIDVMNAYNK